MAFHCSQINSRTDLRSDSIAQGNSGNCYSNVVFKYQIPYTHLSPAVPLRQKARFPLFTSCIIRRMLLDSNNSKTSWIVFPAQPPVNNPDGKFLDTVVPKPHNRIVVPDRNLTQIAIGPSTDLLSPEPIQHAQVHRLHVGNRIQRNRRIEDKGGGRILDCRLQRSQALLDAVLAQSTQVLSLRQKARCPRFTSLILRRTLFKRNNSLNLLWVSPWLFLLFCWDFSGHISIFWSLSSIFSMVICQILFPDNYSKYLYCTALPCYRLYTCFSERRDGI